MRYEIVYQEGMGINEKNQIKEILNQLPNIDFKFSIETLKTNVNLLKQFQGTKGRELVTKEDEETLSYLETNKSSILIKLSELNLIKSTIESKLRLKLNKITSSVINDVIKLSSEFNREYLKINDFNIKYKNLEEKIINLMKVHGSEASSLNDMMGDFGGLGLKEDSAGYQSDDSDSDDSFM